MLVVRDDGDERVVRAAVDGGQVVQVALGEARLRPEEALPPRLVAEPREDVENGRTLVRP
jgi:hypothetical protein